MKHALENQTNEATRRAIIKYALENETNTATWRAIIKYAIENQTNKSTKQAIMKYASQKQANRATTQAILNRAPQNQMNEATEQIIINYAPQKQTNKAMKQAIMKYDFENQANGAAMPMSLTKISGQIADNNYSIRQVNEVQDTTAQLVGYRTRQVNDEVQDARAILRTPMSSAAAAVSANETISSGGKLNRNVKSTRTTQSRSRFFLPQVLYDNRTFFINRNE